MLLDPLKSCEVGGAAVGVVAALRDEVLGHDGDVEEVHVVEFVVQLAILRECAMADGADEGLEGDV